MLWFQPRPIPSTPITPRSYSSPGQYQPAGWPTRVQRHGWRPGHRKLGAIADQPGDAGVVPGDTIRLRYDFGMDGCAGIDGWYVDDVNAYTCTLTVNNPPTIAVASAGQCTNDSTGTMNLTVGDTETAAGALTLSGSSSNTNLVPNNSIVFSGSGANRTVTIKTKSGATGTATVTVTVSDGTNTASVTLTVKAGGNGIDTLIGTTGVDMLFGRNGNDTINANAGIDLACGGNDKDTLSGEGDNDSLWGQSGNDTLTGGLGADFFSGGAGNDKAADFTPSQGDTSDGTIP